MAGVLLQRRTRWSCPNCTQTALTAEALPHSRFHACPGLHGLTAPLVEDGTDCVVEAVERGDYVGREMVQLAPGDGRPYMSVVTRYADGRNDCAVMAPVALWRANG